MGQRAQADAAMSDELPLVWCLIVIAVNWLLGCALMDLFFKEDGDVGERSEKHQGDDE